MFYKKGVLKHCVKITGKYMCRRLFLNKVSGLLRHRYFPVNYAKILRTLFLLKISRDCFFKKVIKLKEKKKRTRTIQKWIESNAKHQRKTTLIISNIKGGKNVNVIVKIWFPEWQENRVWPEKLCFVKITVFCWNIFSENTAKLVTDNVVCEKF